MNLPRLSLDPSDPPAAAASCEASPAGGAHAAAARVAQEFGLALRYDCSLHQLAPRLRNRFLQLGPEQSLLEYFELAARRRHGRLTTWLHRSLRGFLSDFDINGLLNVYPMHVLGTAQWEQLLEGGGRRLLDVGAGDGGVTAQLAPLFDAVTATETSRPMVRRLARRGFATHQGDVTQLAVPRAPDGEPHDVITLLNVLDRCNRPLTLLAALRAALPAGGRLVIALVLPYKPFVYEGGQARAPRERLPIAQSDWEGAASDLVEGVLSPLGFEVESLSRVPYLSGGDARRPLYELDDVVVVCRAGSPVATLGQP